MFPRRLDLNIRYACPPRSPEPVEAQSTNSPAFGDLSYRSVGPYRGGRSTAVTGFPDDPDRWLMGTTGGGIWESTDNGVTWANISDGFFGGSIGAVKVADADPNVIYVGQGSNDAEQDGVEPHQRRPRARMSSA